MNQSFSLDGQPIDDAVLKIDRRHLIEQFNLAVGNPGEVVAALQNDFINGKMPYDEMVSYIRYCQEMVHSAQPRGDRTKTE